MIRKTILSAAITLIGGAALIAPQANAQSFEIGALGAVRSTWLFNTNISDAADGQQDYEATIGYNGGVKLALNITKNIGFEFNYLYGLHQQSFRGTKGPYIGYLANPTDTFMTNATEYESRIKIPSHDLVLLMRLGGGKDAHIELGIQRSILGSVIYQKSIHHRMSDQNSLTEDYNMDNVDQDVSELFSKGITYGVFGVSMLNKLGGPVYLHTGLRFLYSFGDALGVDAGGINYSDTTNLPAQYVTPDVNGNGAYDPSHKTWLVSANFNVGITIKFGDNKSEDEKDAKEAKKKAKEAEDTEPTERIDPGPPE